MPDNIASILNLPDLVLLGFFAVNLFYGWKKGIVRSLYGFCGKLLSSILAVVAARLAAPIVAGMLVQPLQRGLESRQAEPGIQSLLASGVRGGIEGLATQLAESIAFFALFILFGALIGYALTAVVYGLRKLISHTPLTILDSLGGAAIGLAAAILITVLVAIGLKYFWPVAYSEAGWLSPARVQSTLLLKTLLSLLSIGG